MTGQLPQAYHVSSSDNPDETLPPSGHISFGLISPALGDRGRAGWPGPVVNFFEGISLSLENDALYSTSNLGFGPARHSILSSFSTHFEKYVHTFPLAGSK